MLPFFGISVLFAGIILALAVVAERFIRPSADVGVIDG